MLRLIAVSLRLGDTLVLDRVTIEARAGELLLVEGARGAGKSRLLEIAGARRRPASGQVWIADHDVTGLQGDSLPFVRRNIGFVSSVPRFLAGLDVLGNVMLPLAARAEAVGPAREAALRALGRVGAVGLATRDVPSLSASELRLAGIARALAGGPPLVLVDDAGACLGAADQGAVLTALGGLMAQGAAVVCATANATFSALALRAGARRVLLEGGRVALGSGPVAAVTGGLASVRASRQEALS